MDHRLVAWARGVKARQRGKAAKRHVPVLWLFTDAVRLPDPLKAVAALPARLCGVVFRHDGVAGRAALARMLAQRCRELRVPLAVAGDARLAAAVGAGVHLRGGLAATGPSMLASRSWLRAKALVTSSAHSRVELRRAWAAGADAVFLSPVLPTRSHPGAPALGVLRWAALAGGVSRGRHGAVLALGGIDGEAARRLPRWCGGAAAIGALMAGGGAPECGSPATVFRNCHKSHNPAIAERPIARQ